MRSEASVPIRTVEAIDAEIMRLELEAGAQGCAIEDVVTRIDSDQFDGGSFTAKHAREMAAKNARHNGTALLEAKQLEREYRHARVELRAKLAELRAERRLWTELHPMGMLEIAAMLGYSSDTPRQWKRRNTLPAPAGTVSGTPYWWRRNVLVWALANGRT